MKTILLFLSAAISAWAQPEPPPQPKTGAGSTEYAHAAVRTSKHGKGGTEFHLFQPADPAPEGHVRPDWRKFAIAGHSVGGLLTASLGALAAEKGLPVPRALMSVQPGRSARGRGWGVPLADLSRIPAETLLLCLTGERDNVCGAGDALRIYEESAAVPPARKSVIELPVDARGALKLSGSHLSPCSVPSDPFDAPVASGKLCDPPASALIAAAGGDFDQVRDFLCTPEGRQWRRVKLREVAVGETFDFPNAQDFALWRLFDNLCAAAFAGKADDSALARTPEALSMGQWSDGTPARPMRLLK